MLMYCQRKKDTTSRPYTPVQSFICKYWIILAVNMPESLHCCPACARFSRNHIHSVMNPLPILEEEEDSTNI